MEGHPAMDSVYIISMIVGGFFVLLSIFGGGESDSDADIDVDTDFDVDADADFDADFDADVDADFDADVDSDLDLHADVHDLGSGPGFVDLLSVRALFLFAAFFGLTGTLLGWTGSEEPFTAVLSVLTGLVAGLGGNYLIKTVGYRAVSSDVTSRELHGSTANVLVPFEGGMKGKIAVVAKGQRLQLVARGLEGEQPDVYNKGDEVVIIRMDGSVAEVVKPD
jgi:hypothetical protein